MNDTVTFQDCENKYELTVKTEFITICPNPSDFNIYTLNYQYNMFSYLHNLSGPAVVRFRDNLFQYWIDGKHLAVDNPELLKQMEHPVKFNHKLNQILDNHQRDEVKVT